MRDVREREKLPYMFSKWYRMLLYSFEGLARFQNEADTH